MITDEDRVNDLLDLIATLTYKIMWRDVLMTIARQYNIKVDPNNASLEMRLACLGNEKLNRG